MAPVRQYYPYAEISTKINISESDIGLKIYKPDNVKFTRANFKFSGSMRASESLCTTAPKTISNAPSSTCMY